jgi:membrane-bound ClpP family serine protease
MPVAVDPNLVFMVLVLGLWMAVTSVYVPGSGLPEVLSLVGLGAALVLLLGMPTNWLAVLLLVFGVAGFIAIPFIRRQHTSLALGGLALQGAGGLLLFNGMAVSPFLVAFALVLQFIYHQYVLMPAMRRVMADPVVTREDSLIGKRGRVVHPLNPIGTVQVDAELWTATSNEDLQAGTPIVVMDRDGLQLFVEEYKQKRKPHEESNGLQADITADDLPDAVERGTLS